MNTTTASTETTTTPITAEWRDFYALTKPGVMKLVVFTGLCGLLAAPGSIHPILGLTAILCIALGSGGAAALNQWYEADVDAAMKRTSKRPLPAGRMERDSALHFGLGLSGLSVFLMGVGVNWVAAAILAFCIFFYAVIYTMWLKPSTPQNIVIGGAAGAFPPMIGWAAVTGDITLMPILLFTLIFIWTPPHFWALALFVKSDYANAGIPMMPVVAGRESTRKQILAYSVVLAAIAIAPTLLGLADWIYGVPATALSLMFVWLAYRVYRNTATEPSEMKPEKRLFAFSIVYLFVLFGAVVADRYLVGWII
ncbi:heme o synthase [Alterisphingorhabdus coralli]|uniref:Protoheme IX farnesyltransferase n=1 Tax=Alterisphingorhabdus coralli TaxID=3071408 RepID=A0AA97F8S0_9SPHN|nr:heme o synthase [Parasphingorhabdus sp. SCSIO 66989]WOE76006.1 heme o synthase [Parasphingorhabdus sp. SCSIO 66989]